MDKAETEVARESGVGLPAPTPQLYAITYEWEDGRSLRLSMEHMILVRSFARDDEHLVKCLRFLAELPNPPEVPVKRAQAELPEQKG